MGECDPETQINQGVEGVTVDHLGDESRIGEESCLFGFLKLSFLESHDVAFLEFLAVFFGKIMIDAEAQVNLEAVFQTDDRVGVKRTGCDFGEFCG